MSTNGGRARSTTCVCGSWPLDGVQSNRIGPHRRAFGSLSRRWRRPVCETYRPFRLQCPSLPNVLLCCPWRAKWTVVCLRGVERPQEGEDIMGRSILDDRNKEDMGAHLSDSSCLCRGGIPPSRSTGLPPCLARTDWHWLR